MTLTVKAGSGLVQLIKTPIKYVQEKGFQVVVTTPREELEGMLNAPHR